MKKIGISFDEMYFSSSFRQCRRTNEVWRSLQEFVTKENALILQPDKEPLTVSNLLGYFLHRENYLKNQAVADIGDRLFKNIPMKNTGNLNMHYLNCYLDTNKH